MFIPLFQCCTEKQGQDTSEPPLIQELPDAVPLHNPKEILITIREQDNKLLQVKWTALETTEGNEEPEIRFYWVPILLTHVGTIQKLLVWSAQPFSTIPPGHSS